MTEQYKPTSRVERINCFLRRAFGFATMGMGLFLLLSLLTYHPNDPSWSVSSNGSVGNFFGSVGAFFADIVISFLGSYPAYIFSGTTILFSLFLLKFQKKNLPILPSLGYLLLFLSLPATCLVLVGEAGPMSMPVAGIWGTWLADYILKQLSWGAAVVLLVGVCSLGLLWMFGVTISSIAFGIGRKALPHIHRWQNELHAKWLDTLDYWERWRLHRKRQRLARIGAASGELLIDDEERDLPALALEKKWFSSRTGSHYIGKRTMALMEAIEGEDAKEEEDPNRLPSLTPPEMPAVSESGKKASHATLEVKESIIEEVEDLDEIAFLPTAASVATPPPSAKPAPSKKIVLESPHKRSAIDAFAKTLSARWNKQDKKD